VTSFPNCQGKRFFATVQGARLASFRRCMAGRALMSCCLAATVVALEQT
jgi:hypothetical protein